MTGRGTKKNRVGLYNDVSINRTELRSLDIASRTTSLAKDRNLRAAYGLWLGIVQERQQCLYTDKLITVDRIPTKTTCLDRRYLYICVGSEKKKKKYYEITTCFYN